MVSYSQTGPASSIAPIALIPPVKALFLRAGAPGFLIWVILSAPPHAQTLERGRECQLPFELGHSGRHLHIRSGEELEWSSKKRPL